VSRPVLVLASIAAAIAGLAAGIVVAVLVHYVGTIQGEVTRDDGLSVNDDVHVLKRVRAGKVLHAIKYLERRIAEHDLPRLHGREEPSVLRARQRLEAYLREHPHFAVGVPPGEDVE